MPRMHGTAALGGTYCPVHLFGGKSQLGGECAGTCAVKEQQGAAEDRGEPATKNPASEIYSLASADPHASIRMR